MIYSTFSSFMTARSGIVASQLGLNVTAQNMANVNTNGYTRQRLDLVSVGSYSGPQKIAISGVSVAGGVRASGISQLRDQYLDARFRSEMAGLGEVDAQYSIISQLSSIFEEWDMAGMTDMFAGLMEALENQDYEGDLDILVQTQMELLLNTLNSYGKQIDRLKEQTESALDEVDIPRINDIFAELSELTKSIRIAQANGAPDLELEDARNLLLDELSQYMDIDVTYTKSANNPNVMDMKITLNGANGPIELMNNTTYKTWSTDISATGQKRIWLDNASNITEELETGVLKGVLDMLNKSGEFDTPPSDVRGIGYYEEMMNVMVDVLATAINSANGGLNLIETIDGSGNYTMGNLKIADGWRDGTYGIVQGNEVEKALLAILTEDKHQFTASNGHSIFNGTVHDYFSHITTTLGAHEASLKTQASNKAAVVNSIDSARLSISAVSMDEETVNLMMYQKSYNASARILTTLDEALDTLINKTGTVGR